MTSQIGTMTLVMNSIGRPNRSRIDEIGRPPSPTSTTAINYSHHRMLQAEAKTSTILIKVVTEQFPNPEFRTSRLKTGIDFINEFSTFFNQIFTSIHY